MYIPTFKDIVFFPGRVGAGKVSSNLNITCKFKYMYLFPGHAHYRTLQHLGITFVFYYIFSLLETTARSKRSERGDAAL